MLIKLLCEASQKFLKDYADNFQPFYHNTLILEVLKDYQVKHAKELEKLVKKAKRNALVFNILLGLLVFSVIGLILVSLFVDPVTAALTAALTFILAVGSWVMPLLIIAAVVLPILLIGTQLIFSWKKYKTNFELNKANLIIIELDDKLELAKKLNLADHSRHLDSKKTQSHLAITSPQAKTSTEPNSSISFFHPHPAEVNKAPDDHPQILAKSLASSTC